MFSSVAVFLLQGNHLASSHSGPEKSIEVSNRIQQSKETRDIQRSNSLSKVRSELVKSNYITGAYGNSDT